MIFLIASVIASVTASVTENATFRYFCFIVEKQYHNINTIVVSLSPVIMSSLF